MVSELVPLNQLDCEIVAICYNAGGLKSASLKKKYSKFCPLLSSQSRFYKSSTSLFCTSDSHLIWRRGTDKASKIQNIHEGFENLLLKCLV